MKNPEHQSNTLEAANIQRQNEAGLAKLRELLVGIEREHANEVIERVRDQALRRDDVHEVLVEAIEALDDSEQRKVIEHFADIAAKRLKRNIKDKPEDVSAIIYPIMLPAIRQAVADSIRSALERIDGMFKNKLSPQSVMWRLEAKRTGVSYAEVFLRNTMNYGVEQAFLIDRKSGLLLQHVSVLESSQKDEDAVSAMLLAIERFVNDSFNESDENLQRVTVGERLVYIAHGPHALLACVVRGVPPADFLEDIQSILERIHATESDALVNFSGDRTEMTGVDQIMQECLALEFEQESSKDQQKLNSKAKILSPLIILSCLSLVGYLGFSWMQEKRVDEYVARLNALPHLEVFSTRKHQGEWHLSGIIDQSNSYISPLSHSIFLNRDNIQLNFIPVAMQQPDQVVR